MTEPFNSYKLDARDPPIISMFECIRRKLMMRVQVKNRGMENFEGTICPNIQDKLEYLKVVSRDRFATWCGILEGCFKRPFCNMVWGARV